MIINKISNENGNELVKALTKKLSPKQEEPQVEKKAEVSTMGELQDGEESFGYDVNELVEAEIKEEPQVEETTDEKLVKMEFTTPEKPVVNERIDEKPEPKEWEEITPSQKLDSEFAEKDIFSSHRIMNAGTAKITDHGGPNKKKSLTNSIFDPDAIANIKNTDSGEKLAKIREDKEQRSAKRKEQWEEDAAKGAVPKGSLVTPAGSGQKLESGWKSARVAKDQMSIFDDPEKLKNIDKGMDEKIAEQNAELKSSMTRKTEETEIKVENPKTTSALQNKLMDTLLGK